MRRLGRPILELELSAEERGALEPWARRPTTAQAAALRARLILGCAAGKTNTAVARERRVTKQTVGKWRSRLVTQRLDGLLDAPRPGAPRTVTDTAVERVVTLTVETAPREATPWSTRAMARQGGLSQSTVSRIWRAFSLPPHRSETFKRSPDPLFIDQGRDIVGRYLNPPDQALVLCVDEKADPGPGPQSAAVADASRASRAAHPRLPAPRHPVALRGLRHAERSRDWPTASPASGDRVPEVPGHDRRRGPPGSGRPSDRRQLRHPQDGPDPTLACQTSPVASALHAQGGVLGQSGRALVCPAHGEAAPARRPPQPPRPGGGDRPIPQRVQRSAEALRVDEDGR